MVAHFGVRGVDSRENKSIQRKHKIIEGYCLVKSRRNVCKGEIGILLNYSMP